MRFASPQFLGLLILVLIAVWYGVTRTRLNHIIFSDISRLKSLEDRTTKRLIALQKWLRYGALIIIVVALARPQGVYVEKEYTTQGVDIMLLLDVSGSMRAEDFKPDNRLAVAKHTISQFVSKRESDRMGLVVFSGKAFTQCPLTLDYAILKDLLENVEFDMAGEGTSIGLSIATGLNRMKESTTKSKVMILLTDGVNNSGGIDPLTAADLAASLGVKIYTVGIGKEGGAPIPYVDPVTNQKSYLRDSFGRLYKTELDEATLKAIASKTKGQYFRAVDTDSLDAIYDTINSLEKSDIKTKSHHQYTDYFMTLLWLALLLLVVERLVIPIYLRRMP